MKATLMYKGLYSGLIHREEINLVNENALNELKRAFEVNYARVSQYANDVDIFRFCNGTIKPYDDVFKWKIFTEGKITEIGRLVAIEEEV